MHASENVAAHLKRGATVIYESTVYPGATEEICIPVLEQFIAEPAVKQLIQAGSRIRGAKVNVLGITFKEDVPDLGNSKAWDLITELRACGLEVFVHDPVADPREARQKYGIELMDWESLPQADAVIVAVAHKAFLSKPASLYVERLKQGGCFIDVKARFDADGLSASGVRVWRL